VLHEQTAAMRVAALAMVRSSSVPTAPVSEFIVSAVTSPFSAYCVTISRAIFTTFDRASRIVPAFAIVAPV
jgi:hypothetical protein